MLYLVTDEKLCLGRNLADVISEAVKGGVNIIQLRKKNINTRNFIEKAEQIKKLLTPLNIPLIINDRVDVALAIKADGVHLGQDDMPYLKAREILGDNAVIGLSVETTEQVKQAEKWNVNYLGISPVFDTKTKTDIKKPWGIQGIRKIRKIANTLCFNLFASIINQIATTTTARITKVTPIAIAKEHKFSIKRFPVT